MSVFSKAPNSELDFNFDWAKWLPDGETITDAVWSVSPNDGSLAIGSLVVDDTKRGATLTGGQLGYEYQVVCAITTSQARRAERSLTIRVMEL